MLLKAARSPLRRACSLAACVWLALATDACAGSEASRRDEPQLAAAGEPEALLEASRGKPKRATQEGRASYYSPSFNGRKTASGERYDPKRFTAAHGHLPLGTQVRVTRLPAGPSVVVRINDRCGCTHGRVIDLSLAAARRLDMIREGVVPVRIEVIR